MDGEQFTDSEAEQLLALLAKYTSCFPPESNQTVPDIAEDLAMSMDVTTGPADACRVAIETAYEGVR